MNAGEQHAHQLGVPGRLPSPRDLQRQIAELRTGLAEVRAECAKLRETNAELAR